ncbi:zf-HC2 domain-containing protein [Streptomyces sp. NPDC059783]|uniref:zf-HC2 domain-containing protein n=1 Tax=Streptomyces sp. NPDC059783 TaxID=3346944 RepID=UPI003668FC1F
MSDATDGHGDGGREGAGRDDEVRGAPRIPGPRAAADDLDAGRLARPVVPPERREPPRTGDGDGNGDRTEDDGDGGDDDEESDAEEGEEGTVVDVSERAPRGDGSPPPPSRLPHRVLKALLGAWALAACSAEETEAVEAHLTECAPCADEALRLRDAVGLLHTDRSLDLDPSLRTRVLESCLSRRPAKIPVPEWAAPYDAETARLDALLRDIGDSEWHAPVRLKWFEGERRVNRKTTVAGVIGHLTAVDGLVTAALGLDDPLAASLAQAPGDGDGPPPSPAGRTEAYWSSARRPFTRAVREPWRAQSHTLIRTVSFAGRGASDLSVSYGGFALPLQDAMLDRAFECWLHAGDIAEAVDYPYEAPAAAHLHRMIDLAARLLPAALAVRRRAGLAAPARRLVTAGSPGRSLHLEVEGSGGGNWYIPLDSPAALGSAEHTVAQVALDGVEFCRLVAGHVPPVEAAAGQSGDREAVRDVLFAAASLSRL